MTITIKNFLTTQNQALGESKTLKFDQSPIENPDLNERIKKFHLGLIKKDLPEVYDTIKRMD